VPIRGQPGGSALSAEEEADLSWRSKVLQRYDRGATLAGLGTGGARNPSLAERAVAVVDRVEVLTRQDCLRLLDGFVEVEEAAEAQGLTDALHQGGYWFMRRYPFCPATAFALDGWIRNAANYAAVRAGDAAAGYAVREALQVGWAVGGALIALAGELAEGSGAFNPVPAPVMDLLRRPWAVLTGAPA
jgi:hypothetical protein